MANPSSTPSVASPPTDERASDIKPATSRLPSVGAGDAALEAPLTSRYERVRRLSETLCEGLEREDYVVQTMDDVSPTKWHLAHTSWFFETFLLSHLSNYRCFSVAYEYLFNSYYNAVGPQFHRPHRGQLSRPTVAEVYRYRRHVDEHMARLLAALDDALVGAGGGGDPEALVGASAAALRDRVTLGLHHEQQHQELILMDIKHVFGHNPLRPALRPDAAPPSPHPAPPLRWFRGPDGVHQLGAAGDGFCFDNETPRHSVFVAPFELASRCVTNGEYLAFVDAGGYERSEHWLSDGWAAVTRGGWRAPLYWQRDGDAVLEMTLGGLRALDLHAPVTHVSHYEADAYARWSGARLPTEAEWEVMAAAAPEVDRARGNFCDSMRLHPTAAPDWPDRPAQLLGDVWEWTASAYLPYPGYRPAAGAIGEYNGKFMSGQMVLRGGSCVTSASHLRATYRNFFPAAARWPFTGIRLARDL